MINKSGDESISPQNRTITNIPGISAEKSRIHRKHEDVVMNDINNSNVIHTSYLRLRPLRREKSHQRHTNCLRRKYLTTGKFSYLN